MGVVTAAILSSTICLPSIECAQSLSVAARMCVVSDCSHDSLAAIYTVYLQGKDAGNRTNV